MSELTDRIAAVVEKELARWLPTTTSHQKHFAAHVAERLVDALQLTEEWRARGFLPDEHETAARAAQATNKPLERRWVSSWSVEEHNQ